MESKKRACCFCSKSTKHATTKIKSKGKGTTSYSSQIGKGELLDLSATQNKICVFVPLSKEIEFATTCDYINAATIIHPFSTFRLIWDSFIMLILIFTLFEIPLTLSFSIETSNVHEPYGIFVLLMDIVLCFDIIFNFRTAFYDKFDALALVVDPNVIAKKYIKTWFIVDFITSFPFEFMVPEGSGIGGASAILRAFRVVRFIRLLKLIRFFRMLKLVNTFLREFMGPKSTLIIKFMKLIAYMILAAHFAACAWFYVGFKNWNNEEKGSWLNTQNVDPHQKANAYLVSMYWSVVTLFTTGYGDIVPVNSDERIVAMTVVLLGSCFFAYLIGAVGSLVAEGDRARIIREEKFEQAQAFCAHKTLPPQLSRAIMTHTSYFWKRNFVYDDIEILSTLPYGIQCDVLKYHGNRIFNDFAPFDMLPETTKGLLALKLKQFSCNKGIAVYRDGDVAKEFYIQRAGKSILIIPHKKKKKKRLQMHKTQKSLSSIVSDTECDDNNQEEIKIKLAAEDDENGKNKFKLHTIKGTRINLKKGDVFGHSGFFKGHREGTLYCETWSEFYALSKRDLEEVLMWEHPERCKQILREIKKKMKMFKHISRKKRRRYNKGMNPFTKSGIDGEGKYGEKSSFRQRRTLTVRLNEVEKRSSNFLSLFNDDNHKNDEDEVGDLEHDGDGNKVENGDGHSIEMMEQNKSGQTSSSITSTDSSSTDSDSESEDGNDNDLEKENMFNLRKSTTSRSKNVASKKRKFGKVTRREIGGATRKTENSQDIIQKLKHMPSIHDIQDTEDNSSERSMLSDSPLIQRRKSRQSHESKKNKIDINDIVIVLDTNVDDVNNEEEEEENNGYIANGVDIPDIDTNSVQDKNSNHIRRRDEYEAIPSKSPDVDISNNGGKRRSITPLALPIQPGFFDVSSNLTNPDQHIISRTPSNQSLRNGVSGNVDHGTMPNDFGGRLKKNGMKRSQNRNDQNEVCIE